jgi:putative flippase GtrA
MSSESSLTSKLIALIAWLKSFRYVKFGLVGASGTVVNIAVLHLAQTYLFDSVEPRQLRLGLSLALAILVATLSNFTWNRLWTWADRRRALDIEQGAPQEPFPKRLVLEFGRYCMASWFGMAFQFGATIWLSHYMDYRIANIVSIVAASVINFLANDRWTFKIKGRAKSAS